MRIGKKAANKALSKAALTHNCWACLDEAVRNDEGDRFSREYIDGEREMLANAITDEMHALRKLGRLYGINVEVSCVTLVGREACK